MSHKYHFHLLKCLSKEYEFSLEEPFDNFDTETKDLILNGSNGKPVNFSWRTKRGRLVDRRFPFEGVINNINRRYKETESNYIREDLSKQISVSDCKECSGTRLRKEARNIFINDTSLPAITSFTIDQAFEFFSKLKLTGSKKEIADRITKELKERLQFLIDVGLNYLTLERSAESLSGGEAQRIRLASQIGAGLVGVTYILDEPSIGLHQRDNEKLLKTLTKLRDMGNSVIVVEHDHETMMYADHIVDIGPGAGIHGGEVCAQGTAKEIAKSKNSITGEYLSGKRAVSIPKKRKEFDKDRLIKLSKASGHNLKDVSLELPLDLFVCVTGVTGSGKSTTLAAIINQINESRPSNIITIEDPVEFIHKDKKSIVSQREVGKQTESFSHALKAALREDPDVILVGELRDLETIGMALTAAETGHLVFGTLHTSGAPNTINRIIDVFPPEQQAQIRAQISTSLKMVVTQRLLKTKDGQGRVGAFEVMKCTAPIQNLIRESKIHQIPSIMQTAVKDGMITMTKSLEELVKSGKIDASAGKEH